MTNRMAAPWLLPVLAVLAGWLPGPPDLAAQAPGDFAAARNRMVDEDLVAAGIQNPRVIAAMRQTPRHEFVPPALRHLAYYDLALPIGHAQTISPPFIVAYMTEQLDPQPTDKVLEIGTGSGYQAAVLSGLVREVYTIEIVQALANRAAADLKRLRYGNVHVKAGDGYLGWPEHAPFDKIIVTCSPEKVPPALVEQLKEGGRMIIPVGQRYQQVFHLLKKTGGKLQTEALRPTLFVPMTGLAEQQRQVLPDPKRPTLVNGDFEQTAGDPPEPAGWHYQRQLRLDGGSRAPSGNNYVTFSNAQPGRPAQALQGFACDGRVVRALRVSLSVRAKNVRPGSDPSQLAALVVCFYDENRAIADEAVLGPWQGTFPWKRQTGRIAVPPQAREAIVRIGLLGATGEISFDNIRLEPLGGRQR
ncbi:MAG: protein-L-isoaspartate(D-aspartate) O-methyltransferase [Thermoguttaceae bacterium]